METNRLTYLEVTLAISQLSAEDRKKLRDNFDAIEACCDPAFKDELTMANRQAREGKVYTADEAIEILKRAAAPAA